MEISILGPLRIEDGERIFGVSAPKERALLVVLVLSRGRAVSTAELIDSLWGEEAPRTAGKALQTYISNLRHALSPEVITSVPGGYALNASLVDLDITRFELLLAEGRGQLGARDGETAAGTLSSALSLWRGSPAPEVDHSRPAFGELTRLDELRRVAVEDLFEARALKGDHRALVSDLEAAVAEEPLRERRWGQLMMALYRSGRQADALRAFQRVRSLLSEELGLQPSPELLALEQAILVHDVDAGSREFAAVRSPAGSLPAPAPHQTNRPSGVVTFLLTDIEASAQLWERYRLVMPEVLSRHDDLIAEQAATWHGTFLKSRGEGDSTMSVFSRASDAVIAGVELQRRIADAAWPDDVGVRVRVAVHTGEAYERDGDYFGLTVSRAARLRSLATASQVLLSSVTAGLARDGLPPEIVLTDRGEVRLRGLAPSLRVFEARAAHAAVDTSSAANGRVLSLPMPPDLRVEDSSTLVGRGRAMDRLRHGWEAARTGRSAVAIVSGEPGIGKTRLAAELARVAARDGGIVIYGRCDDGTGAPYQPFASALGWFVRQAPQSQLPDLLGDFGAELSRLHPAVGMLAPLLGSPTNLDPDTDRYRLYESVSRWLSAVGRMSPVLFVIDDLHWAAEPTLFLFRHLIREAELDGVMLIGTFRSTELTASHPLTAILADLRRVPVSDRLSLTGLDTEAIAELMRSVTPHAPDSTTDRILAEIAVSTGGNPFFLQEVLAHMLESGKGSAQPDASSRELPDSIREVVTLRLSRLTELTNRVLAAASVAGQTFGLDVVARVADAGDDPEALADAVDEALRAGILEEDAVGYRFRHALISDTIARGLSPLRRARLHRRIGESLEALGVGLQDPAVVAHHLCQARDPELAERAARYALAAATQAFERLALEEAVSHCARGLDNLTLAIEPIPQLSFDLHIVAAEAHSRRLAIAEAREAAHHAGTIARELSSGERLARVAKVLSWTAAVGIPDSETTVTCRDALKLIGPDQPGLRVRVLATLSISHTTTGDEQQARTFALEALSLARPLDSEDVLYAALECLLSALACSSDYEEQSQVADELIAVAENSGKTFGLLSALQWRATVSLSAGKVDAFLDDWNRIRQLTAKTSWAWGGVLDGFWRAMWAMHQGRLDEVEGLAQVALAAGRTSTGILHGHALQMFWLRFEQGRLEEFQITTEAIVASNPGLVVARAALPLLYREIDMIDAAVAAVTPFSQQHFEGLPAGSTGHMAPVMLAHAVARLGRADDAAALYRQMAPFGGRLAVIGAATVSPGPFDHYLGMLAACCERWDDAIEHYSGAIELEVRVGCEPTRARTEFMKAQALQQRNAYGDRQEAHALGGRACDRARGLGMARLAAECEQWRAVTS